MATNAMLPCMIWLDQRGRREDDYCGAVTKSEFGFYMDDELNLTGVHNELTRKISVPVFDGICLGDIESHGKLANDLCIYLLKMINWG